MIDQLEEKFKEVFGQERDRIFFAPGRVNLIGEHIDYNGGLVMPCGITFGTYLLTAPNKEGIFRFRSANFDDRLDIELRHSYTKSGKNWYNYPLAVIHYFLKDEKKLNGVDFLFYGNLPIGAGLSSSASIETVTAFALNSLFNTGYSKLDLVKLNKRVENEFIGVNSGIMDQFAVTFAEKNKALKLNCDTLDYEAVDSHLGSHLLVVINTNKPRSLAESKYNERVSECQTALKELNTELKIDNLCDLDSVTFEKYSHLINDTTVRNRAKHVVEENDRVLSAARALAANNLEEFGKLMYASHHSLQNLYEVSGKELDTIVEFCSTAAGVAGARMTGAGFGGCAIALVEEADFEYFKENITAFYTQRIGYAPSVYSSAIGDGVKELSAL